MHGSIRGALAVPVFLLYTPVALDIGGTEGLGGSFLLALGALVTGYVVGSPWALLIALPFTIAGVTSLDSAGPLENVDDGWGMIILLALAAPVAFFAAAGSFIRTRTADDLNS